MPNQFNQDNVVFIRGSFADVFSAFARTDEMKQYVKDQLLHATNYHDTLVNIFKDLPRQGLTLPPSAGITDIDHNKFWSDVGRQVSHVYGQGDINGSAFKTALVNFILTSPYFIKEERPNLLARFLVFLGFKKEKMKRNEDTRTNFMSIEDYSTAFYDDTLNAENQPRPVPCAFSAMTTPSDDIWYMSAIRNTLKHPNDKEAIFILPVALAKDMLVPNHGLNITVTEMSSENAENELITFLNSTTMAPKVKGLLLPKAKINVPKLRENDEKTTNLSANAEQWVDTKSHQLELIRKQYARYTGYDDIQLEFKPAEEAIRNAYKPSLEPLAEAESAARQAWETVRTARKEQLKNMNNPEMNAKKNQSFIRRNFGSFGAMSFSTIIGLGVVLAAVFAPIAIPVVAVGLTIGAGITIIGAGFIGGLTNIGRNERELSAYKHKQNGLRQPDEQEVSLLKAYQKAQEEHREIRNEMYHTVDEFRREVKEIEKQKAEIIYNEPEFVEFYRDILFSDKDMTDEEVVALCANRFPIEDKVEPVPIEVKEVIEVKVEPVPIEVKPEPILNYDSGSDSDLENDISIENIQKGLDLIDGELYSAKQADNFIPDVVGEPLSAEEADNLKPAYQALNKFNLLSEINKKAPVVPTEPDNTNSRDVEFH